ncbi:MAG: LPD38 domain-containing protein [Prevotella denticola]
MKDFKNPNLSSNKMPSDDGITKFRVVRDGALLAFLDGQPTKKGFRYAQWANYGVLPPMTAKRGGEWRTPMVFNRWEQSEEGMRKANGKADLVQGNGRTTGDVAYNPYFHIRTSPLNDQFTAAYDRPELIVVEGEYPVSEETSGYRAEGAKDSVGLMDWHSGSVNGQLDRDTKVQTMLSRYFKPRRIVPWSEVADNIMERIGAQDITFPINVVPPMLRAELAKRGARFGAISGSVASADVPKLEELLQRVNAGEWNAGLEKARAYLDAYESSTEAKMASVAMLSEKLHTPIRVISDPDEIAELPSRRRQRAKGWWSSKNDEVVILLPNNANVADVANTVVHEVVGHKGLRKLIGEERFDEFLNEVYGHASKPIRAAIDQAERKLFDAEVDRLTQQKNAEADRLESRKGIFSRAEATVEANRKREQMRREATEEYMADMAGRIGDEGFEKMSAEELTFWGKVKAKVQQFLDKFLRGLKIAKGVRLTDKDVAYILYKSWKNMRNGGKPTVMDAAEDALMRSKTHYDEIPENDVMFRDGDSVEYRKAQARNLYEQRVSRKLYQMQEAIQDSMLGLKEAMEAVLKAEGGYTGRIEDVAGYENPYLGENRLSSVNQAECAAFAQTLFKPMLEEVARLAKTAKERAELTDYMMAKHGLERNEVMARRAAEKVAHDEFWKELKAAEHTVANEPLDQDAADVLADVKQRMQDRENELYAENRSRDYAGLTALTGKDDVADAESEAEQMVSGYEADHDTTDLWGKVNAVTKATLQKTYECGIISKETFDNISDMYEHYIPLRGFDEKTSDEAYAYLSDKHSAFNAPVKTAKGRKSKADDPFANMEAMAESAIMQGNRNMLVKRKFMRFAQNHPSDLVSISDLWLRYDDVADEWKPLNAGDVKGTERIEEDDAPREVERKMRDFEEEMRRLSESDPDHFKKQKDHPDIPYRVVGDRDLRQHQVLVKQGGKDYVLTINGNPRAAQALNGQTNPDNDASGAMGAILHYGEVINRQLSAFYTTRNPDFVVSNFMRDMLYANTMVWAKESPNYALRFHKNFAEVNPAKMKMLFARLRKGTLDVNNETEKAFSLFMANGGETGYSNIRDIEQRKNDIRRELKKYNGKLPVRKALALLGERFDEYNRAVENCARFAAFMTSRQMKRSIDRSVYDAKEISVNFNKKGSGAKFMNKTGQTPLGNAAALVSGLGRSGFVFWNAAIQGTTNFGRQFKRHPGKALAGAAMFLLGALVAGIAGDDGNDGSRNSYYNLPEYVRRSNIMFRMPGMEEMWVSIPLPVEYRALYGMGELMMSTISGKEHYTSGELAGQIAGQVSQALPIDFMEGGGGFKAFVPSAVKPFAEVMTNKSWTGMPLYKDTPWNKDMPEWTKAYKSANKQLVGLSKVLNEVSGGDAYTSGVIDINPAQVEYLLNGYFGGVSSTIDKFAKMGETALGQREYDPRSFLILNRLVKSGDERTEYRHINNEYFRLKEEHDKLKSRLKHYEEDTNNGVFDYAEKISWLNSSPEYQRLGIFEKYSSYINAINKELKEPMNDNERKELERELYGLKKKLVEEADKTRK